MTASPHFFGIDPAMRIGNLPIVQYEPGTWEQVFRKDRPCVVRGFVASWPAWDRWDLDSLVAKAGDRSVWATVLGPRGTTPLDYPSRGPTETVLFSKVVEQVESMAKRETDGEAGQYYLAQGGSIFVQGERTGNLSVLADDIRTVDPKASANLWLGAGGQRTYLHYDQLPGVMHVLRGTKHFLMVPPGETRKVRPTLFPDYQGSDLAIFDENEKVSRFKHWTLTLERGDSLFIPAGTWHAVRNVGLNLAVNNWWAGEPQYRYLTKPSLRIYYMHLKKKWVLRKVTKLLWPKSTADSP